MPFLFQNKKKQAEVIVPDGPSLAPKYLKVTIMVPRVVLTAVPTYKENCQYSLSAVRKNVSRMNSFPPDLRRAEDVCLHCIVTD